MWTPLVLSYVYRHFESEPLHGFAKIRKWSALYLGIFFSAPPLCPLFFEHIP